MDTLLYLPVPQAGQHARPLRVGSQPIGLGTKRFDQSIGDCRLENLLDNMNRISFDRPCIASSRRGYRLYNSSSRHRRRAKGECLCCVFFESVALTCRAVPLCGIVHESLVTGQEEPRVNDVEDPDGQAHQHAVQDVEQGLHLDDRSFPAIQQLDGSVHGSMS